MHKVVHKGYLNEGPGKGNQSSGGGINKYPRTEMDTEQRNNANRNLTEKIDTMPSIKKAKLFASQKENAKKKLGKKFKIK